MTLVSVLPLRPRPLRRVFMVHKQEGCFFMSVPNLKPIAQFVQKFLRGPKISKFGHVTQATPTLGSFCGPDFSRGPSSMYVSNLKRISLFVQNL